MKSRKLIIILLAAAAVLILSSCYRTTEQRAEHMVKYLAAELKLDESQTAKLETIKDEFLARRPGMIKLREESVREANELMRSADIDQARLNALVDRNQTQINELVRFVFAKFTEIHDMLTPAQREKLVVMIERHMKDKRHAAAKQETGTPGY